MAGDDYQLTLQQQLDIARVAAHNTALERDRLEAALRKAEAALADIGDSEGRDRRGAIITRQWCERRAREVLPQVRAALKGE